MPSKYVDTTAIMQVIGCVFNTPQILSFTDKYTITDEDFPDEFHRIAFGSIYKIYELGAEKVSLENINDFLKTRPKNEATFKVNKGEEWLLKVSSMANNLSFDYYYNRLKKMTLLRAYDNFGLDVSFIYDIDNILDVEKKQVQEDNFDNMSLSHLAQLVDDKMEEIKNQYVYNMENQTAQAGEGIFELIDRLQETPEIGVPLYGPLINTVTRGARLKKFYLRSAATGIGKSRSMIADTCNIGCSKIYDENFGWISNGVAEPVLFITTEQELEEIQTMMLAFLANVNEEHILNGEYYGDEKDRVRQAAQLIEESPIYVEMMPDFSLKDIEDRIKKNIRDNDVKYVFDPKRVKGTVKYFSANQAGLAS